MEQWTEVETEREREIDKMTDRYIDTDHVGQT